MRKQETEIPTSKKSHWRAAPNINVTPLIDVLLVLLIIFMVIQPQREAKFETQIPQKPDKEEEAQPVPPPDLLVVEVKAGMGIEQTIELNTKPMSLMELSLVLKEILKERSDKAVYIKAPREKPYRDIICVIDKLKEAGASPIGLQIDFLY